MALADDTISVRQELESDLEPDACEKSFDQVARDGFENETLEIKLPRDGLHHRSAKDEEGHIVHAKLVNTHRQNGRESSRHAGHADVVPRAEQECDEADDAGKEHGQKACLDRILRHQANAHRQWHCDEARNRACERIAPEIVQREDRGFLCLFRDEQITRERLLPLRWMWMVINYRGCSRMNEGGFGRMRHYLGRGVVDLSLITTFTP